MNEGFTAQIARLEKNAEYVAGEGMFKTREIAKAVLPRLRGGQLFAYLFRRFGYPTIGWDGPKNLVSYLVTSPMAGIFLEITPYMGGDYPDSQENDFDYSCLMFRYFVLKSIKEEFVACLRKGGHAAWSEHPRYKEVNQAIEAAMRDLLRPVYVRDVPINCYGKIKEDAAMLPHVKTFHAAGLHIPRTFFETTERWEQFTDALIALGNGSLANGLDAVVKMGATAESDGGEGMNAIKS